MELYKHEQDARANGGGVKIKEVTFDLFKRGKLGASEQKKLNEAHESGENVINKIRANKRNAKY